MIGEKHQNVGGFKSVRSDLSDVPSEGWLYNDRTKWNDNDTTITVKGEGGTRGESYFAFYHSVSDHNVFSLLRNWETMVQRKSFTWWS